MIFRYADGSVFEGEWEDAPGYGIQTIVYHDASMNDVVLRQDGDFYRVDDDGCIVTMDWVSLLNYVIDDLRIVKAGSMISRAKYAETMLGARADQKAMRESG